ncbi:MAG: MATE family efflux transporter [Ruminococcaceae bacterium]|nr:MATE family efflux transporter [Oscillospiraceae bacterium]
MTNIKSERKEFWSMLLSLALPIAFQHLLVNSLTFIDTLFMSQLGDIALSASGMAGQWNWLMNMISFGLCSGSALFIAQYWGAKKISDIRRTHNIAVVSGLAVSIVFALVAILIPDKIMWIFNRNTDVIKAGSGYLSAVAFAYPATVMTSIQSTVLRSTEKVRLPMAVSCISVILNVFLDYAMIFGKFGFAPMGMRGAAIATAVSAWIGYGVLLIVSFFQSNIVVDSLKELFNFNFADYRAFMKKASPVIFNELMWGLGTVCTNAIYSNTGYENYAACTILRTVESICMILFIGLNDGGAVIVGKTIGEGKLDTAYERAKRLVISAPVISAFIATFAITFKEKVIYLFNMSGNITSTTVAIAGTLITIYAIELCFRNIPYTMVCAIFRSGGDSVTGAKFDIICLWGMAIPASFIAAFVLKIPFIYVFLIGYLVEDIPKSIMCIRHFVSRKWIKPVTLEKE